MTSVQINDMPALPENGLSEHLVVCDKSGRVLGHFLPTDLYRMVCLWASAQVTTDEHRRRLNEPGGRSLAEIWARLSKP